MPLIFIGGIPRLFVAFRVEVEEVAISENITHEQLRVASSVDSENGSLHMEGKFLMPRGAVNNINNPIGTCDREIGARELARAQTTESKHGAVRSDFACVD